MANQQTASSIDLASLAMRARDAYDQKRTKECLTLTKSLLMADPQNAEGKALQAAIRSDIQRNLADARALLEDSRRHDLQEHRKTAEILLLKIIYLDPEHAEAKALLSSAKSSPAAAASTPVSVAAPAPVPAQSSPAAAAPAPVPSPKPSVAESAQPIFAVEYKKVEKPVETSSRSKLPLVLAAMVVVAGVLIVTGQSHFRKGADVPVAAAAPAQPDIQKDVVPISTQNAYLETAAPELLSDVSDIVAAKEVPAPSATVISAPPTPVAPVIPGTLAVSSPTSTEIYQGDKYLGSTPITLELPAGTYSLEYRHGDLRQFVTHVVKPRETITAMVTFDVTVQINARPWAQVSIDGAQRRSLGQTPLSDIKVPIGSALVFENPNFPAKTYRVTGKETAIQIVFP
jgi:hypothetical protein